MAPRLIATIEEIRSIRERALRLLDEVHRQEEEADEEGDSLAGQEERSRLVGFVIEALRFCALASGALEEPSLADVVAGVLEDLEDYDDYAEPHPPVVARALRTLLRAGWQVDERVHRLARDKHPVVREAIAGGLRPDGHDERELLRVLLTDAAATVRNAARASLETVGEVPWWTGKWKSDPAARLLPEERETAGPALRRVNELLDLPGYALFAKDPTNLAELHAELAKLPHEIALEATEKLCRADERHILSNLRPLLLQMLGRPGGVEAFCRLVEHWGRRSEGYGYKDGLAAIVAETPHDVRLAVCRRCIDRVVTAPAAERNDPGHNPVLVAASIAGSAWPPGEDVREILDAVFSPPDGSTGADQLDYTQTTLADALTLDGVDPAPVLDRLVEARLAGYPGPWTQIRTKADTLLSRAPREVLRRLAEQALEGDDTSIVWALETFLGPAHDPALDGSLAERAAAFAADPHLRPAILVSERLRARALPWLRGALRRGELSYPEIVGTLEAVSSLWGGLGFAGALGIRRLRARATSMDDERRKVREAIEPFLPPPELAGPPTEAEWEVLRAAREAPGDLPLEERAALWLHGLSEGPWRPDELAGFDELLALFRSGEAPEVGYHLAFSVAVKLDTAKVPLLDEVVRDGDEESRPLCQFVRSRTRALLGVADEPPAAPPAPGDAPPAPGDAPPTDEWGDEDIE